MVCALFSDEYKQQPPSPYGIIVSRHARDHRFSFSPRAAALEERPLEGGGLEYAYDKTEGHQEALQPAQDANALESLATALNGREQQVKRGREAFENERRVMTTTLDERQEESDEQGRLSEDKNASAEKTRKPVEVVRMKVAADTVDKLAPSKDGLLTIAESRTILMLYFGLMSDGISPNQAAIKVSLFGSLLGGLS